MGNFRLCTFGQAMVQIPGSAVWGTSDLKGLRIVSGQTMVQKRPNDGSSHISSLPERERRILCLHSQAELTMKQIALSMHVDESRVSQLHSAALTRLKARVDSLLHPTNPGISESGIRSMAAGAAA
jgi:DNA-binding CsgD family transcriptional regulator